MKLPHIPTVTVSMGFGALAKKLGRYPCSVPILLDISSMENVGHEELQATWLSVQEQHQLSRYALPKRRREWLAGRICAKMAILDYLGTHGNGQDNPDPADLSIVNSEAGRPFINPDETHSTHDGPEISISHSGNLALAIAAKSCCGVDIQKTSEGLIRVKERFCSKQEEDILLSTAKRSAPIMHLTLSWAAKEAAQKALGGTDMPGLLDLQLTRIEKTDHDALFFIFNRRHRQAHLVSEIRVLVTGFGTYGIGICIPQEGEHHARTPRG